MSRTQDQTRQVTLPAGAEGEVWAAAPEQGGAISPQTSTHHLHERTDPERLTAHWCCSKLSSVRAGIQPCQCVCVCVREAPLLHSQTLSFCCLEDKVPPLPPQHPCCSRWGGLLLRCHQAAAFPVLQLPLFFPPLGLSEITEQR